MSSLIRVKCNRCGADRMARAGRPGVCADCYLVDPRWPYTAANTPDGSGEPRSATHRATLPAPTRRGTAGSAA